MDSWHKETNASHLRIVSDIAIFVLKRDVKLQLTNSHLRSPVADEERMKLSH